MKHLPLISLITPVFNFLKTIPKGNVVTYATVAAHCGVPSPRNVGWILQRNTDPDKVPCYKVVRSDGRLAGGYKFGGQRAQRMRLSADSIEFSGRDKISNIKTVLWK